MQGSTQAENATVAKEIAQASVANNGAEVIHVSDDGQRFAIESEWLGNVVEVAKERGYTVDTINARNDTVEVLFKQA